MQKKLLQKMFRSLLFAMKITGQPQRKACNLNFRWKICSFFSRPPLTRVNNFRGPLFASGPLTSVCEWSLSVAHLNYLTDADFWLQRFNTKSPFTCAAFDCKVH